MKNLFLLPALIAGLGLMLASTASALAGVHYVDVNSTNATPPYTNWSAAATNIQDAVDAAVAGDEVVVTNGAYQTGARDVYGMSNRVAVTKPVAVRSVNGPAVTSIVGNGQGGPAAVRCVYLTNAALLAGFTLTNGATQGSGDCFTNQSGGGVWCESSSAVLSNCVLTGNSTSFFECGGLAGGAYSGTLMNCILTNNVALGGGGAAFSTLNYCTLSGNGAYLQGGGVTGGTLNSCTLVGNVARNGGGADGGTLNNCTLVGNSGSSGGGANYSTLNNCIVYPGQNLYSCGLNHCWTTDPLFVDTNGWANLRLRPDSPCINAGNNSYVTNATDLDGNPRISGGGVDIGAYEFQLPRLTITPSGTNVILSWPVTNAGYSSAGFFLQQTVNLGSPGGWAVADPFLPIVVNGQYKVTRPMLGPGISYRLGR